MKMKFGKIEIDPAKNPAILDTATWDMKSAWDVVCSLDESYWRSIQKAIMQRSSLPIGKNFIPYTVSLAQYHGSDFFLAGLADGQQVFIEIGADNSNSVLGKPIGTKSLQDGSAPHSGAARRYISAYKTDADVIDRYLRFINPDKGPRAMGTTARLGIGSRMSTAAWPGVWRAMRECHFSANAIQNSLRELNVLEDVLAGRPPQTNYLFGFGAIKEGHTGSTFEGLWVAGVLEAIKTDMHLKYGADADHIMIKRGPDGISRAKRVIEAARYYTFFTLDVCDIIDYEALRIGSQSTAEAYLTHNIPQTNLRKQVLAYHSQKRSAGGYDYNLDKAAIGRLVGKYWPALNAVEELYNKIKCLKNGIAFDLELSIDENPPQVSTFDCLTTDMELIFLILEAQRRQIPLTHIAPNVGIEKGTDYRCPDGRGGLEQRVRRLYHIVTEFGVMLDFHSGDDLESPTRRILGRATEGQNHFKISPFLQLIFAEVLNDFNPEQFRFWWDDTLQYARSEVLASAPPTGSGSAPATGAGANCGFAADCLRQFETDVNPVPSPHHAVFRHYNFASVGRRDSYGQYVHREKFYDLSPDFYREYQNRVALYLCDVANDVFNRSKKG